ncbi:MAG: ribosomal-processing cysteine protease Prp [Clostridiaceae bacterium]|nr:ribosomal-processing cysteine protease Prp [Clostridiaceae bacterium]
MIRIRFFRDKEGFIWKFDIRGHSGYAEKGKDIICAGVSALGYTAVGALAELTGINNYAEKEGYMECSIPGDVKDDLKPSVKVILETVFIGLKQIENSYKEYVVVEEEEVQV